MIRELVECVRERGFMHTCNGVCCSAGWLSSSRITADVAGWHPLWAEWDDCGMWRQDGMTRPWQPLPGSATPWLHYASSQGPVVEYTDGWGHGGCAGSASAGHVEGVQEGVVREQGLRGCVTRLLVCVAWARVARCLMWATLPGSAGGWIMLGLGQCNASCGGAAAVCEVHLLLQVSEAPCRRWRWWVCCILHRHWPPGSELCHRPVMP